MFLFISGVGVPSCVVFPFKYILCSYLSETAVAIAEIKKDLNTSYVLIYSRPAFSFLLPFLHLNTSYVLIYRFRGNIDRRAALI